MIFYLLFLFNQPNRMWNVASSHLAKIQSQQIQIFSSSENYCELSNLKKIKNKIYLTLISISSSFQFTKLLKIFLFFL